MSHTNRSTVRRSRHDHHLAWDEDSEMPFDLVPVPVDTYLADNSSIRVTLESVIRAHRGQLVSTARQHLRNRPHDAEDLVQDLCLEVLEGRLELPLDPTDALDELLREVKERCRDE
jgi:hypothetical protein